MEVINIEAGAFEAMMNRFEAFTGKEENLCGDHQDKSLNCWLDKQDVKRENAILWHLVLHPK